MKNNEFETEIVNFSEEQKLELFKVEELESRLEMAALIDVEISANGVCWIG